VLHIGSVVETEFSVDTTRTCYC